MELRGSALLLALLGLFVSDTATAVSTKHSLPLKPVYGLGPKNKAMQPCGFVVTALPHWNGTFADLNGKTACYTMVGTDPSQGGATTTVPVYIIPIRMKFGPDNGNMTFDPEEHTVSNGLTVVQNIVASPLFDSGHTFKAGTTQLGKTQYVDAFQRGNFWSSVQNNPSYHVLLGQPQILSEQEVDVGALEGEVKTIGGIKFGVMDKTTFTLRLLYFLAKSFQIDSGALTIFVTYNTYLDENGHEVGGFHGALPTCLVYCRTYAYATYVDTGGANHVFAQDVSAVSHEIAEWMDNPFANNIVSCSDPSLPQHQLEVGDPLQGKEQGRDGWGDYPYKLNGFTYNLQSLVFLPYFGAPSSTSVNGWTSFHGPKDSLGVCSQFTTFDPEGSTLTWPESMNASGTIAGYYQDSNQLSHGFFRTADGTTTPFDVSGSLGTSAFSINSTGSITGYYYGSDHVSHGFVRAVDGAITPIDVHGSIDTVAKSINDSGSIAGDYDNGRRTYGFLRGGDGVIAKFDVSGSSADFVTGINAKGSVTGYFADSNNTFHGFLRASDGTISTFDAPGAGKNPFHGTNALSINSTGSITGTYEDDDALIHSFVRFPDGTISTFDVQESSPTIANSINDNGAIAGGFVSTNFHGFVRAADGTLTTFDVPESGGTIAQSINASGAIAGVYFDSNGGDHGFVRGP